MVWLDLGRSVSFPDLMWKVFKARIYFRAIARCMVGDEWTHMAFGAKEIGIWRVNRRVPRALLGLRLPVPRRAIG
jgi:hypothetical protein